MFNKVLVPLDGSELSECSLPYVINLAKDGCLGEAILLRVVDIRISANDIHIPPDAIVKEKRGINQDFYLRAARDSWLEKSRSYLARVEAQLKAEGIKVESAAVEGNRPAEGITDFAKQRGVDMIVMATHGYTGIKKMLIGSVAFKVLHESEVPVLLIRPERCRV